MSRAPEDRFNEKIDRVESGCWLWMATKDRHGYGWFYFDKKMIRAYRAAWMMFRGPIPDGLEIDHLCRVPSCVNPDHLEPVTHRENMLRGDTFGARHLTKTHCPHGHPYDEQNTFRRKDQPWRRICRICMRDSQNRNRAKRREQLRAYHRAYYAAHRETITARQRDLYHAKKGAQGG